MATTYVRKSIWGLETPDMWDPYTTAYARAVAEMITRSEDDPTSWTYQAAMHGSYSDPPANAVWNQCQHGSWFFLPWHRMYIYWFERIVRAIVVQQGGPSDWALPFWNYSAGPPGDALPPAFRQPTWDPGTGSAPNPLYTTQRAPRYNSGTGLPARLVNLDALNSLNFTGAPLPGFGGPVTGFSHEPQAFGLLENVPHNQVHVQIGGQEADPCLGGLMVDPNCAAQDPIFWLHHANIDRLWSEWIASGNGRANPTDPAWLSNQVFTFFDETGTQVTMTSQDVLDTVTQLSYEYEPQPAAFAAAVPPEAPVSQPPSPPPAPTMVAASEGGLPLTTQRADLSLALPQAAQAALRRVADPNDDSAQHVYLNVEGLKADHTPGISWEVHLNLPPDAGPEAGDHLVGVISFFGFRRQLDPDSQEHGLGPMVHTFDITDLVQNLRDRGEWDDLAARVSFIPVGPHVEDMTARPRVGRVSITFH